MKKRLILVLLSAAMTMLLAGCELQEKTEVQKSEKEEKEFEILKHSDNSDNLTTMILLDKKENVLYGLVKVTLNNAGSEPGEIFVLMDSEGNPYVYDGIHIPELILHEEEQDNDLRSYIFSDSIYDVRYALVFTSNNDAGAYTGNVVMLLDAEGKPSTY